MDRTKFIVNLAQKNKEAYHHSDDVGMSVINVTPAAVAASDDEIEDDFSSITSEPNLLMGSTTNSKDNEKECLQFECLKSPDNKSKRKRSTMFDSKSLQDDVSASSFVDFESSGSEYVPSTESGSSKAASDVIPYQASIKFQESSKSKVKRYLNNLSRCSSKDEYIPLIYEDNFEFSDVPGCSKTKSNVSLDVLSVNDNTNQGIGIESVLENKKDNERHYKKKPSAPERPTICPICYKDVVTHFTRHLIRHHKDHKDVILLQSLKPKSKKRLALVSSLRKQGYFHLKVEKGILNPVRTAKASNTEYFVCTFCLGHYSKRLLYKHVKTCSSKPPDIKKPGEKCLTNSQSFMASINSKNHDFLRTSRIKQEVFGIMRPDDISNVAKNDPLICLYGEILLNKHKRQQMATVISNKIREMGRLLIALRSIINNEIKGFFDALKPEMYKFFIIAAKQICGFNPETKCFRAPSLAMHLRTSLTTVCDVAFKLVVEKQSIPNITWTDREEKKKEIKELKKLIEQHWCNELSSLALKNLKEKHWEKPIQLPLTSDIQLFQSYLNKQADEAYEKLNNTPSDSDTKTCYKMLTECVLTLTVMFNRKRIGDVQYLKIETYTKSSNNSGNQEAFLESLTTVEKILSTKFKRVVTGGKGSKPVPILFSKKIQKFINCLLEIRKNTNVVPESNPYLFANPGSENRWMSGTNVIRKLALNSGASNPLLLTSTRFRKHIATTLQLMSMEDSEMEQLATFMGHTKKTHAEFYRLPQDIYQTAKVAKVLLLMEKGRGKEFKGKSLHEIDIQKDVYYSSESENESEEGESRLPSEKALRNATLSLANEQAIDEEIMTNALAEQDTYNDNEEDETNKAKNRRKCSKNTEEISKKKGLETSARGRWTNEEKKIVLNYFAKHIKRKVAPKKHECEDLKARHKDILGSISWVRIKTLVYNTFRDK